MVSWEWFWMEKKKSHVFPSRQAIRWSLLPCVVHRRYVSPHFRVLLSCATRLWVSSSLYGNVCIHNIQFRVRLVTYTAMRTNKKYPPCFLIIFIEMFWGLKLIAEPGSSCWHKNNLFFSVFFGANISVNSVFTLLYSFLFHCGRKAEIKVESWTFFFDMTFRIGNGSWHYVLRKSKMTCKALCSLRTSCRLSSSANEDIPRLDQVIWSFCIWQNLVFIYMMIPLIIRTWLKRTACAASVFSCGPCCFSVFAYFTPTLRRTDWYFSPRLISLEAEDVGGGCFLFQACLSKSLRVNCTLHQRWESSPSSRDSPARSTTVRNLNIFVNPWIFFIFFRINGHVLGCVLGRAATVIKLSVYLNE